MSRSSPESPVDGRTVYSVTDLTRRIKSTLERAFGMVWVEGELSNVRQPGSGHLYFTIKDAQAQISAVMFRGNQRNLKFRPADGVQVRAFGELTVYERNGNYQVIVRTLEEAGQGALLARFEALKEALRKEGLFDAARKRAVPVLPRHVGVVTSPTGAAIRDILNVISRRFPNLHVVIAPARVQGDGAAEEIAGAIDLLNRRGGLDVLIVGRGGGSMEDLWCFNEEVVARAMVRSRIPVISAVGHEVDFTISDFVADLRAPTPSAAAELVVECKEAFETRLAQRQQQLLRSAGQALLAARSRLRAVEGSYVFREPGNLVRQYRQKLETTGMRLTHQVVDRTRGGHQRLDAARMRIEHATQAGVRDGLQRLERAGDRLEGRMTARRDNARRELDAVRGRLHALSPLAVLKRGYSVTTDDKGRVIRSAHSVRVGQRIVTRVDEGCFESAVTGRDLSAGDEPPAAER